MKISEELKKAYAESLKEEKRAEKKAKKAEKLYIDAQLCQKLESLSKVTVTNVDMRTLINNTTFEDLKIAFSTIINSEQFYSMLHNELTTSERIIRIQQARSEKAKKRKNAKSNPDLMLDNAASNAFNALDYNDTESIISMDSDHKDPRTKY